ncbi:hypothetical protein ACLB2K_050761 [Fragaria x ananassa]
MDWRDWQEKSTAVNENLAAFNESLAAIQRRIDEMVAAICKQQVEKRAAKEAAREAAEENEKALQRQNVKLTVGEDFPLDEPTSKERNYFVNR